MEKIHVSEKDKEPNFKKGEHKPKTASGAQRVSLKEFFSAPKKKGC